jgi:hypothetical protein
MKNWIAEKPANLVNPKLGTRLITGRHKLCPRIAVVSRKAGMRRKARIGQRQFVGLIKPLRSRRTPESAETALEMIQTGPFSF